MLYYLRVLESGAALPWSTCPYTPVKGHDRECAGLKKARKLYSLLLTTRCSLLAAYYSLLTTHYSLLIGAQTLTALLHGARHEHLLRGLTLALALTRTPTLTLALTLTLTPTPALTLTLPLTLTLTQVRGMNTYYEAIDTKRALLRDV